MAFATWRRPKNSHPSHRGPSHRGYHLALNPRPLPFLYLILLEVNHVSKSTAATFRISDFGLFPNIPRIHKKTASPASNMARPRRHRAFLREHPRHLAESKSQHRSMFTHRTADDFRASPHLVLVQEEFHTAMCAHGLLNSHSQVRIRKFARCNALSQVRGCAEKRASAWGELFEKCPRVPARSSLPSRGVRGLA